MARRTPMMGTLTDAAPDGGGTFSRASDQPMPPRDGMLCLFTVSEAEHCGGGEPGQCCGDPQCQEPAPDTAMGYAGVQDATLALRWTDAEA